VRSTCTGSYPAATDSSVYAVIMEATSCYTHALLYTQNMYTVNMQGKKVKGAVLLRGV